MLVYLEEKTKRLDLSGALLRGAKLLGNTSPNCSNNLYKQFELLEELKEGEEEVLIKNCFWINITFLTFFREINTFSFFLSF